MSHTPPPPAPETIREVSPPFWLQRTWWTMLLAFASAAPVLVDIFVPLLTPDQATKLVAVAGMLAALAAKFGRDGGTEAAATALTKARSADRERTR